MPSCIRARPALLSAAMSTAPAGRAHAPRWVLASAAIAAATTTLVCLPSAPGLYGLAGVLLVLGTILTGGAALLVVLPQAFAALVPVLISAPMILFLFACEAALMALAALMLLHGWRTRAPWLHRITPIEAAFLLWMVWAMFTGCWSEDARLYFIGVRKLLMSLCTIWVATRLPAITSRRWFDTGIISVAISLSLLVMLRYSTTGLSAEESALRRPLVTDLGWGRSNYLAAILVLCTPSLLRLILRGPRPERWMAGVAFALVTAVQLIVASRAAAALFLVGTLLYLLLALWKYRLRVFAGFAAVVTLILVSPLGEGLLSRMFNLRELGSMTIRIWYFREGWVRLVEYWPWGMGLWQGYKHSDKLQGLDPHNFPLLIGGDLGIVGLLLWGWLNFVIARAWWRTRVDEASRDQAGALLITLVLAHVNSLVEPTFQGPQFNLMFFWIVTGTLAYAMLDSENARHVAVSAGRPGLLARAGNEPSGA